MEVRPQLISAMEVARLLGCSRSYVYKLARAGDLGYVALGEQGPGRRTAMRFPSDSVAAFLRARTVHPRQRTTPPSDRDPWSPGHARKSLRRVPR